MIHPTSIIKINTYKASHSWWWHDLYLQAWQWLELRCQELWVSIFGYSLNMGSQLSSVQNPCWLMVLGDCTTQYIGDYDNPIGEPYKPTSIMSCNGMIEGFWTLFSWSQELAGAWLGSSAFRPEGICTPSRNSYWMGIRIWGFSQMGVSQNVWFIRDNPS